MSEQVTHTALDANASPAPGASVSATVVDEYGVAATGITIGAVPITDPVTATADAVGYWSALFDATDLFDQAGTYYWKVTETDAAGTTTIVSYVEVLSGGGPYLLDDIAVTLTAVADPADVVPFSDDTTDGSLSALVIPKTSEKWLVRSSDVGQPTWFLIGPETGPPGCNFLSAGTKVQTVDRDYFGLVFELRSSQTFYQLLCNVTTGPGVDGHIRVGIYRFDSRWNPVELINDSETVVTAGFTGVLNVGSTFGSTDPPFDEIDQLRPGVYGIASNVDQAMTLRCYQVASNVGTFIRNTLTANEFTNGLYGPRAYGAFPEPGFWSNSVDYGASPGWSACIIPRMYSTYIR